MELRTSWQRFCRLLGYAPARATAMTAIEFNDRLVHAVVHRTTTEPMQEFTDIGMPMQDLDSAFEALQDRYGIRSLDVIARDELLKAIMNMTDPKTGQIQGGSYFGQLEHLRRELGLGTAEKSDKVEHRGERSAGRFYPRPNFILRLFHSLFADLLPDRKLLFLGIVDEERGDLEGVIVEFDGRHPIKFHDPDWSTFDWRTYIRRFVNREGAERFVSWCESRYMLPTYAIFITAESWQECRQLHEKLGAKQAWRHFLRKRNARRELDREVIIEPEPWPLKASIYAHVLRSRGV